jgi:endonuclease/exonuclease/phosphatase family metal-dependent hydrolase
MDASITRRRALQSGAVLAGAGPLDSVFSPLRSRAGPSDSITVLTWNLYLGSSLRPFVRADTTAEVATAVDTIYERVADSDFSSRVTGIVDEIEATDPDVLGLQEVVRVTRTTDSGSSTIDFLERLRSELDSRNLSYSPVATGTNVDESFDANGGDGDYTVAFVDRDVLLAKESLQTARPLSRTYLHSRLGIPVERGFCAITVDDSFTVVTTHLAVPANGYVQLAQAWELVTRFDEAPTVVLGDLNSGPQSPGDRAYGVLTTEGGYVDVYAATNPDSTGHTCCQGQALTNETPALGRRIDHVLAREGFEPQSASRVGHEPDDTVDGRWPSNHAGVFATLGRP